MTDSPVAHLLECFNWDNLENGVQQPPVCVESRALVQREQQGDHNESVSLSLIPPPPLVSLTEMLFPTTKMMSTFPWSRLPQLTWELCQLLLAKISLWWKSMMQAMYGSCCPRSLSQWSSCVKVLTAPLLFPRLPSFHSPSLTSGSSNWRAQVAGWWISSFYPSWKCPCGHILNFLWCLYSLISTNWKKKKGILNFSSCRHTLIQHHLL